ncbi:glycosyltransferase [Microbacterium sp. ISL-103]|uniref:glycosyltransferase n=1 Tax=Microbacterium sp. ISL-103 TaxID=2819156 RepID=UPI001BEA9BF0|nr:glycosyltransferase [Microbacterium sp. ISL-103]MBT2475325.1 glycosyltransferase [Microbacterium sp. ISL-103]
MVSESPAASPVVDVIVAVHNTNRPVERAVASALRSSLHVRVSVVAHNVASEDIAARLGRLADDPRVRILALADGVRSPANAFNCGLDAATGEFVTIIGSDDSLEDGALDSWVALAERHRADAVVAPIVRDDGHGVPTPRIRPSRSVRLLDADRDRLFERTAALGLQRRRSTDRLRYADGLPRGVDQSFGLRLWTSSRVVFDPASPVYREHSDQNDRVTHVFGPLGDDFAFLDDVIAVLAELPPALRRAVVSKLIRVHVVPAVRNRLVSARLQSSDLDAADGVLRRLWAVAPGARALLPRALSPYIEAVESRSLEAANSAHERRPSRFASAVPQALGLILHRHAPLRTMLAGRAVMRRVARGYVDRRGSQSAEDSR